MILSKPGTLIVVGQSSLIVREVYFYIVIFKSTTIQYFSDTSLCV